MCVVCVSGESEYVTHHDGQQLEVSVCLRAVVDVRLTADRTDHVAHVALTDRYLKVMLQAVTTHAALAARWA